MGRQKSKGKNKALSSVTTTSRKLEVSSTSAVEENNEMKKETTNVLLEKYHLLAAKPGPGPWTDELRQLHEVLLKRPDIGDSPAELLKLVTVDKKDEALDLYKAYARNKSDNWESEDHLTWASLMMMAGMCSENLNVEAMDLAAKAVGLSCKVFGRTSERFQKSTEFMKLLMDGKSPVGEDGLKLCDYFGEPKKAEDDGGVLPLPSSLETSICGKADHVRDPSVSGAQIEVAEADESGNKIIEDNDDSLNQENGNAAGNSSKVETESLESSGAAVNYGISSSKDTDVAAGSSGKKHNQSKRSKRLKKKTTDLVMQRYRDLLMEMGPWTDELKDYHAELIKRTDVDDSMKKLVETIVLNLALNGHEEKAVGVIKTYYRQKKYAWKSEDELTWDCYVMLAKIYAHEGYGDEAMYFAGEAQSLSHDGLSYNHNFFVESAKLTSNLLSGMLKRCYSDSPSELLVHSWKPLYQEPVTAKGKNASAGESCRSDGPAARANGNSSGSTNQGVQLDKVSLISKTKETLKNKGSSLKSCDQVNIVQEQVQSYESRVANENQPEITLPGLSSSKKEAVPGSHGTVGLSPREAVDASTSKKHKSTRTGQVEILQQQLSEFEATNGLHHPETMKLKFTLAEAMLIAFHFDQAFRLLMNLYKDQARVLGVENDSTKKTLELICSWELRAELVSHKVMKEALEFLTEFVSSSTSEKQLSSIHLLANWKRGYLTGFLDLENGGDDAREITTKCLAEFLELQNPKIMSADPVQQLQLATTMYEKLIANPGMDSVDAMYLTWEHNQLFQAYTDIDIMEDVHSKLWIQLQEKIPLRQQLMYRHLYWKVRSQICGNRYAGERVKLLCKLYEDECRLLELRDPLLLALIEAIHYCYQDGLRHAGGVTFLRKASDYFKTKLGPDHASTVVVQLFYSLALVQTPGVGKSELEKGEVIAKEVHEKVLKIFGNAHEYLRKAKKCLVYYMLKPGKKSQAARMEAVSKITAENVLVAARLYGTDHPTYWTVCLDAATTHIQHTKNKKEARKYAAEAVKGRSGKFGSYSHEAMEAKLLLSSV